MTSTTQQQSNAANYFAQLAKTAVSQGKTRVMPRAINMRSARANGMRAGAGRMPTDVQSQPIQTIVCRFLATNTGDTLVTVQNLLGWQIAVANTTTGTAAISTSAAFRITRVKFWGINDSATANVNETISLTWIGQGGLGLSRAITSTGSDALPAHIDTRPPVDSECGWWHNYDATQTTGLFYVSGMPLGSILDIHLDYITTGQNSVANGTVAATGTTQLWVVPLIKAGVYRQQLTAAGTLGGTVTFTPVGLASLSPTSQSIV